MPVAWTTEQVLSLAPSKHFVKTSRNAAAAEKWLRVGHDDQYVWGEFPNQKKPPFQVKIALTELTFDCTCASRRMPCLHSLGLLLLFKKHPPSPQPRPDWMTDWIDKQLKRKNAKQRRENRESARLSIDQKRLAAVQAGLQELDLWLQDMVRNGLVAVRNKPVSYWMQMAHRLVDAQAGGAAHELRLMSSIPKQEGDWSGELLQRIGRLYLLIEGFNRFDTLSPETQADLQTAVGWLPKYLTAKDAESAKKKSASSALIRIPPSSLRDYWHVLGQQLEPTGKRHVQRIWLWGQHSDRPAQIVHIIHGLRNVDNSLVHGTVLEASLGFYRSATPLRARIVERFQTTQPQKPVTGHATILSAMTAYSETLALNPWLKRFPMALTAVIPEYDGDNWFVRDEENRALPLPAKTKQGWHLRALSGGRPLPLFGVWNGRTLTPLTVWSENRWLPLHMLRPVK